MEEYNKKQSIPHYNKRLSKERLNYNQRGPTNDYSKIPNSYYQSEYNAKQPVKIPNKVSMSRALGKEAMIGMESPPHASTYKLDSLKHEKLSRHGNRHSKKTIHSPQMGGSKPPSRRMGASHYRVAMESGGYNRVQARNSKVSHTMESKEPKPEVQQVPLKVFDMHGHTRAPKIGQSGKKDPHGLSSTLRRTAGKNRRSKERAQMGHQKSPVKGSPIKLTPSKPQPGVGNLQKGSALANSGQKCSPIITTHPYRLGFLY